MALRSVVCTTLHRLVGASLPSNGTQALGGVPSACVAPLSYATCSNPHDATTQWLAWLVLLLVCCLLYVLRQR